MRQITLQRLQAFVAVYEHRSISAAARALGVSQPTASRHLRDLEAAIELSLFVLDRGRVVSTAEADALYADSRFLKDGITRLEGRIDALRRGAGSRFTVITVRASHAGSCPEGPYEPCSVHCPASASPSMSARPSSSSA